MIRFIVLFSLSVLLSYSSNAQIKVSGKVIGNDSKTPIAGATIVIQGTTMGTVTDANGNFELKCNSFPVQIVVNFAGYKAKVFSVSNSARLTISLDADEDERKQTRDRKIKNVLDLGLIIPN